MLKLKKSRYLGEKNYILDFRVASVRLKCKYVTSWNVLFTILEGQHVAEQVLTEMGANIRVQFTADNTLQ